MSRSITGKEFDEEENVARLGPRQVPIPDDWEAVPFEEAIELNPRYDKPDEGPFDYLPMDAIDEDMQTIKYWTERQKDDCTTTWFKNGDTVYAKITPCTENGKIAFINSLDTEVGSGSTEFLVFHPREGVTDERFVYHLANLPEFRAVTISLMEGSTGRQRVPTDVFSGGLEVPLPPLPEQRLIADVLSTVDKRAEQMRESVQKSKELAKGLRQDILLGKDTVKTKQIQIGPKTKEISENWKTAKLGDIGREGENTFIDGDWVESSDMVEEGEYQLIQLGNVGIGEFKGECDKFVSQSFFEEKNCTLVEQGDLLISRLADPVMRTTEVPEFDKKSITAVDIVIAKVDESEWDKRYLLHLLNSKVMSDVGASLATGSTRLRISRSNMAGITIPKPPLSTQSEIAAVLDTVQRKSEQEEHSLEQLQELKRGLMQDLLTGRRRLKPDS
jgi:type I restriction enzyme S subunit